MSEGAKRRRGLGLTLLPWGFAALVAAAFTLRLPTPAEPLPEVEFEPRRTAALERQWIDEAFPVRWLPAVNVEPPCPVGLRVASPWSLRISAALTEAQNGNVEAALDELHEIERWDPSNWVPSLSLGVVLLRAERLQEAEVVLERASQRSLFRSRLRSTLQAVERRRATRGPVSEDVLGILHLLHARASAALRRANVNEDLSDDLFDALKCAELLALRADRFGGLDAANPASWLGWKLPPPGCQASTASLTGLDLYNNLLLAILQNDEGWSLDDDDVRRELHRGYNDPPHLNPLLALLRGLQNAASLEEGINASLMLAVGEAEKLLRILNPPDAAEPGPPLGEAGETDAAARRLALNLATLVDSQLRHASAASQPHLVALVQDLVSLANADAGNSAAGFAPRQLPERDRAVLRLRLRDATRTLEMPAAPARLSSTEQQGLERLHRALDLRRHPAAWRERLLTPEVSDELKDSLGERAGAWLAAGRADYAVAVVLSDPGNPDRLESARRILANGPVPEEIQEVERRLGGVPEPEEEKRGPMVLATLGAWLLGWWAALQLANRRDLRTSFYRREAQRRLRDSSLL